MSGESAAERWSPAQRVESVVLSIISLLDDPEPSSPANVDAGVLLRKDLEAFKARVKQDVEKSKKDIPEGFTIPTKDSMQHKPEAKVDDDFWCDSDVDDDFAGSDTDEEMTFDDEEGEGDETQEDEMEVEDEEEEEHVD